MNMQCSVCGSWSVTWRGPLSALTHTECGLCGARDCHKTPPALRSRPHRDDEDVLQEAGPPLNAAELSALEGLPLNEEERRAWAKLRREGKA